MNDSLFSSAKLHIPGGVNSPARAFKSVSGSPVFFRRGSGACLYDVDGKVYIDYVCSWGPMIAGHAHPAVTSAVKQAVDAGLSFGAPTEVETRMAAKVCELMPAIDKVRMVNSGTEAAMSAIRLARGFTGRNKIIKFEGCYHGHVDSLLVKAGSGALTLGVPTSAGVPEDLARHTLTLDYNKTEKLESVFTDIGDEVAAVIVEPIAGNMNCVPGKPEFLQALRRLCTEHGCLLIFDEVMSGFRVALGGAQSLYNITPDLSILGKVIGGGMPVGAFGGKADIMDYIAPDGPVYQAGTLSGNPVAMTAGLATMELISEPGFFEKLGTTTQSLTDEMSKLAKEKSIAFSTNAIGGMFGLFFNETDPVEYFDQVMASDTELFRRFFHGMLEKGIYLAPSAFEAGFVSSMHTTEHIDRTLQAADEVFKTL